MFGYIYPEKPELKIREYELFKAYYCGMCKSIGKRCGQLPRFLLNYDSVFLALLLSSLEGEKLQIKRGRCIAHPFKKGYAVENSDLVDYASDMNILLAYYNLKDNWKDDGSILAGTGILALKRSALSVKRKYADKCVLIEKHLADLSELEKSCCNSMDIVAEPFALLMKEVLTCESLSDINKNREILRWIGYNIGKWIYLIDAYDDIEGDIRKKTYNVFLHQFQYDGKNIDIFKEDIKERVEFSLTYSLSQIVKAYELMDIKGDAGVVENIIYMGMLRKTESTLGVGSCRKVDESV